MTYTVRPIGNDDHDAINALHRSVGWPERSIEGWRWLASNPALIESQASAGWLLESSSGEAHGFTGNFVQRFDRAETTQFAASGFSIIVQPSARGASRLLLNTFANQPEMFARYTFNANRTSSPLYKRHAMVAWPATTHAVKLSWPVDTVALAGGRLWREVDRKAPSLTAGRRERLMNARLGQNHNLRLPDGVARLTDLGDRSAYSEFWNRLRTEGRLIADRSPATLRWRLADPDLTLRPLLLTYRRGEAITGFAMAMMAKNNPIEPPVLEVIDIVALHDEPAAVESLMEALVANAQALGAAKVRIQVVNEALLRQLGPMAFSARDEGGWGHCHVKFDPGVAGVETWAPTPYDGDYGICLRPVPLPAKHLKAG